MNSSKMDVPGLMDQNTTLEGKFKLMNLLSFVLSVRDQSTITGLTHANQRYFQPQEYMQKPSWCRTLRVPSSESNSGMMMWNKRVNLSAAFHSFWLQ